MYYWGNLLFQKRTGEEVVHRTFIKLFINFQNFEISSNDNSSVVRNKLLIILFPQPWMNKWSWLFCNMRDDRHNELSVYLSFYLLLSISMVFIFIFISHLVTTLELILKYFLSNNNDCFWIINLINTFVVRVTLSLLSQLRVSI